MIDKTASLDLHVEAECEGCSHRYDWTVSLSKTTSSAWYGYARDPTPGLMKEVSETFEKSRYGLRRCPKCGYLQSWMRGQWEERNTNIAIALSLPLFVALGYLLGWPRPRPGLEIEFRDLIKIALTLFVYFLGLVAVSAPFQVLASRYSARTDPNAAWHVSHGPAVPAPKPPRVRPARAQ